jgi:hypothetical protein
MTALSKPAIILTKLAFQKFTTKIISNKPKFKKTKLVKIERINGKNFSPFIGDNKKLIARLPPTTTA